MVLQLSAPDAELPDLGEPTITPACPRCAGPLARTPTSMSRAGLGTLVLLRCPLCGDSSWWRHHDAYAPIRQDIAP